MKNKLNSDFLLVNHDNGLVLVYSNINNKISNYTLELNKFILLLQNLVNNVLNKINYIFQQKCIFQYNGIFYLVKLCLVKNKKKWCILKIIITFLLE